MKDKIEFTSIDEDKLLNPVTLRINLLVASLFILAFESMKATIIEGVKDVFVFDPEPDKEHILSLKEKFPEERYQEFYKSYESNVLSYKEQVGEYEKELNIKLKKRDHYGLIPSCEWLKKEGVLTTQDIENLKKAREHRNQMAHELPALLVNKGSDIDFDHLEHVIIIYKKVDPFFSRIQADIPADVPDDSIMSGGRIVLSLAWDTVLEYLQELKLENAK